ncbi:arginine-tRNA-protein transferase [Mycena belliarum]|uniref:Arginyl-tRNA--protein transferase 1 n=1 Tax=Mycena belliarum TaxID=1033014 RepID=A0AAD6UDQ3_9AGAR|nr:arginine-tRNA-protein transferase [Mycena belliae]
MTISVGTPSGPSATTCGYCSAPGTRSTAESSIHAAGLLANQLSCQTYQKMIDRGWRRSGTWCYKPDLKHSCCPSYTIKLDAIAFKPSKSQRKLVNRWNRFIVHGKQLTTPPSTSKASEPFSFLAAIHAAENGFSPNEQPEHKFETMLEPSSYSTEKFELYRKYQGTIHSDTKNTPSSFRRFLANTPLRPTPIPYPSPPPSHLPINYGSYHQLYRCDGKLIAIGIIDILPNCVSSVYFMYDPVWEDFSLGKLSALREISLALEIRQAGATEMASLYMGFYIHSCQKMRYKGEYLPSYLADPETYVWFPLLHCIPLLEKHRYACFSYPEHSSSNPPSQPTEEPPQPSDDLLSKVHIVHSVTDNQLSVVPVKKSPYWNIDELRSDMIGCIEGLGHELATEIIFRL